MEDLDIWVDDVCSERSKRCKCGKVMDNLKSKLAVYFESFSDNWDDRFGDCGEFILSQCANCKKKQWWVLYSFHWGAFQPEEYFDSKAEQDFWDYLLRIYANNTSVKFRPQVAIKNGDSYFFIDFVHEHYSLVYRNARSCDQVNYGSGSVIRHKGIKQNGSLRYRQVARGDLPNKRAISANVPIRGG